MKAIGLLFGCLGLVQLWLFDNTTAASGAFITMAIFYCSEEICDSIKSKKQY